MAFDEHHGNNSAHAGDAGRDGQAALALAVVPPRAKVEIVSTEIVAAERGKAESASGGAASKSEGNGALPQKLGWRGWLRAARIGRVLALLNLYLFLENYEAQAKF